MKLVFYILLILFWLQPWSAASQPDASKYNFALTASMATFELDGQLNEAQWQSANVVQNFQMHFPSDTSAATSDTEVRMLYDKDFLYIGAICRGHETGEYIVQSLKRDFDFRYNDAFTFFVNAFADGTSGFAFSVNAYGVQKDGIVAVGGVKGISDNWDGAWLSEVFRDKVKGTWSLEMAIPFKTLRFGENAAWHINFARNNISDNEISTWVPVPRGVDVAALSCSGNLNWDSPPTKSGTNVVLIPYVAHQMAKNYEESTPITHQARIGTDAKIALTSSLNLDLTINPDFSQAEVDEQVIDLNRFELSFPERRLFFLENSDLFSRIGNSRVSPFFSRRIGGADNKPVPILFGARLSGKLNNKWRIGLMNVQTEGGEQLDVHGQNYAVAVIERSAFKGSSLSAFIINRQAFQNFEVDKQNFNRVGGIEFDYRSSDSKLTSKTFFHYSTTQDQLPNAHHFTAKIRYKTAKFNLFFGLDAPSENYITDIGFVPHLYHRNTITDTIIRIAYQQFRSNGYYRLYTKRNSNKIDFLGFHFAGNIYTGKRFDYQEHDLQIGTRLQMRNKSSLDISWNHKSPILFFPFQLDELNKPFLPNNYPGTFYQINYKTSVFQSLSGVLSVQYGDEYLGKKFNGFAEINYRHTPWGILGLNVSRTTLHQFPSDFGEAMFTLIGSKIEISFSRKVFYTTFLQYNTQTNNFNINSRFQWRIKPMSDLYLVYTENYRADNISIKDRALVLKMNYWIGL